MKDAVKQIKKMTHNFKRDALKVHLSLEEKNRIANNIFVSPYSYVAKTIWNQKNFIVSLVMLAFVITGGGTSYAAAGALPGDALYDIKVNDNEEIRSFVAISADAKAQVEVIRANERLNEAVKLSESGKLDKENEAIITANLKKHTDSIKANVAVLTSENKIEEAKSVIDGLQVAIDGHEENLKSISNTASTTDIISSVAEVKAEINTIEKDINTKATSTIDSNYATSTVSVANSSSSLDVDVSTSSDSSTTSIKKEVKKSSRRKIGTIVPEENSIIYIQTTTTTTTIKTEN